MLKLRKVTGHIHAQHAYRVVMTMDDGSHLEIGSIGLQAGAGQRQFWSWGLDTVLPSQAFPTRGEAADRNDAMAQFKAMWEQFTSDPERLSTFLADKLRRLRP
jgi:hypothetical protein